MNRLKRTAVELNFPRQCGTDAPKVQGASFLGKSSHISKRVAKIAILREMNKRDITAFDWIHTLNSVASSASKLSHKR
jgi:hypothetical protein